MKIHLATNVMKTVAVAMMSMSAIPLFAQDQPDAVAKNKNDMQALAALPTPRTADDHPDLSGRWLNPRDNGGGSTVLVDGNHHVLSFGTPIPGAKPAPPPANSGRGRAVAEKPAYKPEFQAKVAALAADPNHTDPTAFTCLPNGVPRMGAPGMILESPGLVVLLYGGSPYSTFRTIPTDGREHRKGEDYDANPMGDSVGHWEGDTLVIDTIGFDDSTWFGLYGYFHTDAMRVTERITRMGDTLHYAATVEDSNVLTKPYNLSPVTFKKGGPNDLLYNNDYPCDQTNPAHDFRTHADHINHHPEQ
jgi:hypothetical protein